MQGKFHLAGCWVWILTAITVDFVVLIRLFIYFKEPVACIPFLFLVSVTGMRPYWGIALKGLVEQIYHCTYFVLVLSVFCFVFAESLIYAEFIKHCPTQAYSNGHMPTVDAVGLNLKPRPYKARFLTTHPCLHLFN